MGTARISQVQHFSLGDGPGIRTTVFFQGCSLHCPWCHNPEAIPQAPVLLYHAARCTACGRCAAACGRHEVTPLEERGPRPSAGGGTGRTAPAAQTPAGAMAAAGAMALAQEPAQAPQPAGENERLAAPAQPPAGAMALMQEPAQAPHPAGENEGHRASARNLTETETLAPHPAGENESHAAPAQPPTGAMAAAQGPAQAPQPAGENAGAAAPWHRFARAGCTACGRCAAACPAGALEMSGRARTTADLLAEVLEDRDFYAASGGGVTLSGGEALLQPQACAELAAGCRAAGVPVLLDTAGCLPFAAFAPLLPYLDMCYFDVKTASTADYRAIGGDLDTVLANLRRLCELGVPTVARVPVIPGFNDTLPQMQALAGLLQGSGVQRVDLLPFHRLAAGKYAALGRAYPYAGTPPLQAQDLAPLYTAFGALGV